MNKELKYGNLLHKDLLTRKSAAFHEIKPVNLNKIQLIMRDKVDD